MRIFLIRNLLTGIPVFVLYNIDYLLFIENTNNEKNNMQ